MKILIMVISIFIRIQKKMYLNVINKNGTSSYNNNDGITSSVSFYQLLSNCGFISTQFNENFNLNKTRMTTSIKAKPDKWNRQRKIDKYGIARKNYRPLFKHHLNTKYLQFQT